MDSLNVLLVQARLRWRDPQDNREHLQTMLQEHGGDPDVIVFPETFTTGFMGETAETDEGMDGETIGWMREIARDGECAVTGSVTIEAGGRRNRLIWVGPDGGVQHYDKRHLFSYAGEDKRYISGTDRVIFDYEGWRICPQICYDLRFPVWCRSRGDYDLMLVVANWPAARIDAWSTLLKARAIENQSYVAAVNRVGEDGNGMEYPGASVVHDPVGETVLKLQDTETCGMAKIDIARVRAVREKLPFHREADRFSLLG